jgi:hypothetical protein
MRLLFAIAHYHRPAAESPPALSRRPDGPLLYSSQTRPPAERLAVFRGCLEALRRTFAAEPWALRVEPLQAEPVPQAEGHELDVVVCTTRGAHLLDRLPPEARWFQHHATDVDPLLPPFECHAVLRDRLGAYDSYCYLEGDLILRDPWFFRKLAWFTGRFGPECVLLPYRYEVAAGGPVPKLYLDGDVSPAATAPFQDVSDRNELATEFLGELVRFVRPLNPHAGGFFLTEDQMRHWAARPYFLDRDVRFIGPLESAAALGLMRTFRVYKPAPEHANFLEVEHGDVKNIAALGGAHPMVRRRGSRMRPLA